MNIVEAIGLSVSVLVGLALMEKNGIGGTATRTSGYSIEDSWQMLAAGRGIDFLCREADVPSAKWEQIVHGALTS